MTVILRLYHPDDRAACAQVFFRAVHEGAASAYSAAQRNEWAASPAPDHKRYDKLLSQHCVVAERDGAVIGFMSLRPDGYLDMAFVLPEEMGKGTAGLLYDQLLVHARATGMQRLTVHASVYSRQFLARRGWRVDEVEDYEQGGQHFDRFCMSLLLHPAPSKEQAMTTIRRWNPPGMPVPASRYSHAVLATGSEAWLHLAGQVGMRPDGTVAEGLRAQIEQCLANVDVGLAAGGMTRADVVKLTFYLTIGTPEAIATYRAARDAWTGAATPPASTLLIVAGLASPALLVEVDCVAAK